MKDGVSLSLGLISVLSWGFAEVPQILTNYREKSAEGLSMVFLLTWILGDLFNLFGCMLEPNTLPTQFYMAVLYTITSLILTTQTIYYGYIYHHLKTNRWCRKVSLIYKAEEGSNDSDEKVAIHSDKSDNGKVPFSSPIPVKFPAHNRSNGERYYKSARYLSRSHNSAGESHIEQKTTQAFDNRWNSVEEPLLSGFVVAQSAPPSKTKTMLCVVSSMAFFLGGCNLRLSENSRIVTVLQKPNKGIVIGARRTLLEVSGKMLSESAGEGMNGIGSLLGWGMAAIYMGGRLPQIFLNIRRGNVKGLNPCMFILALVGNTTYVASILVSSLDWSKLQPNLPWLVDAVGCALLDIFIIIQFFHFSRGPKSQESKPANSNAV